MTDEAEKEASEVLHSLLSVERIEKRDNFVVDTTSADGNIVWNNSMKNIDHEWVDVENTANNSDAIEGDQYVSTVANNCSDTRNDDEPMNTAESSSITTNAYQIINEEMDSDNDTVDVESCTDLPEPPIEEQRPINHNSNNTRHFHETTEEAGFVSPKLESSAAEVKEKFAQGCECTESNCFAGLNADAVFRHRLNVAELTREEHDMYLMGVTMACLGVSTQTHRNKERQRQRAIYVHQGKRVCLDAFVYLENVTQYHLKRIRQHVMSQGVVPRVHGNIGKKPHNTFSLDMYKCAENFIKQTIAEHQTGSSNSSSGMDSSKPVFVSTETRSTIYEKFRQSPSHPEGGKIMGYTTFRHFIKKQFPNVRFAAVIASPQQQSKSGRLSRKTSSRSSLKVATESIGVSRSLQYTSHKVTDKKSQQPQTTTDAAANKKSAPT